MTGDADGVRAATDDYIRQHGVVGALYYFRGVVGTWQTITELALHAPAFEPMQQFATDSLALYRGELAYVESLRERVFTDAVSRARDAIRRVHSGEVDPPGELIREGCRAYVK